MANCPNCGSNHIQLKRESKVNWGRAVAGWALLGIVGGAVGAVTGEDRNTNVCLNCGTSWKATDLYKTLQIIKKSTGKNLNLEKEEDRIYMDDFMLEISPYLEEISKQEKEGQKLINEAENKSLESTASGCGGGCLISFASLLGLAGTASGLTIFLWLFIPPIVGALIGGLVDLINKKSIIKKQDEIKSIVEIRKQDAIDKFNHQVKVFMNKRS